MIFFVVTSSLTSTNKYLDNSLSRLLIADEVLFISVAYFVLRLFVVTSALRSQVST